MHSSVIQKGVVIGHILTFRASNPPPKFAVCAMIDGKKNLFAPTSTPPLPALPACADKTKLSVLITGAISCVRYCGSLLR